MIDLSDKKLPEKNVPFELCIQKMLDEDFPIKFREHYPYRTLCVLLSIFQYLKWDKGNVKPKKSNIEPKCF